MLGELIEIKYDFNLYIQIQLNENKMYDYLKYSCHTISEISQHHKPYTSYSFRTPYTTSFQSASSDRRFDPSGLNLGGRKEGHWKQLQRRRSEAVK